MSRIQAESLATIRFELLWESAHAEHNEVFLARRVDFRRDVLPPDMGRALMGLSPGKETAVSYRPGEALPARDEAFVWKVETARFSPPRQDLLAAGPGVGRYYPRKMFRGLSGVYPQDVGRVRVIERNGAFVRLDGNAPLASRAFMLRAHVLDVRAKARETGVRTVHWLEQICDHGPGMQAPLPGRNTDFQFPVALRQVGDTDAPDLCETPGTVERMDTQAQSLLAQVYRQSLNPGEHVLDLMGALSTSLPAALGLRVFGPTADQAKQEANPALAGRVIHDLNARPRLNYPDATFDAVTVSLALAYLADPLAVLDECRRVLKPGGRILAGFSNRWRPEKTVALWPDLHEFERLGLVMQLLQRAQFGNLATTSVRNWWRPNDDPQYLAARGVADPVYVVRGGKA